MSLRYIRIDIFVYQLLGPRELKTDINTNITKHWFSIVWLCEIVANIRGGSTSHTSPWEFTARQRNDNLSYPSLTELS